MDEMTSLLGLPCSKEVMWVACRWHKCTKLAITMLMFWQHRTGTSTYACVFHVEVVKNILVLSLL
jgi:hypothetical protein